MKHEDPVHAPHGGHEASDAKLRPLVAFVLALSVFSAAMLFLMRWTFDAYAEREAKLDVPRHPLAAGIEVPPEPRLEPMPGYELPPLGPDGERPFATKGLAEHRQNERTTLESYGWIDKSAGIVRVPIDRAIELTLKDGLPIAGEKKR